MKANKIKLAKPLDIDSRSKGLPLITHALPFYKAKRGIYFHRVRTMQNHFLGHSSVSFWCGNSGLFSRGRARLYAEIPEGEVLCAICEGKAIGAGEDGARVINGRDVMYSPRN